MRQRRTPKPVVMRSIEDPSGQRCVDLRRDPDGTYSWVECRRDPEDAHGWRYLGLGGDGFSDEDAARRAASAAVAWMKEQDHGGDRT